MATRRQRQSVKRLRDKLGQLERRCDRLIVELDDAAHRLRSAWQDRQMLEAQNRRILDVVAKYEVTRPIVLDVPADLAAFRATEKGG